MESTLEFWQYITIVLEVHEINFGLGTNVYLTLMCFWDGLGVFKGGVLRENDGGLK